MPSRYFANRLTSEAAQAIIPLLSSKITNTVDLIHQKFALKPDNCDGGIYVGLAGAAYAFWYAASKATVDQKERILEQARKLVDFHLAYCEKHKADDAPFLLGNAGVYAIAVLVYNSMGESQARDGFLNRFAAAGKHLFGEDKETHGSDELFVGRCGYLCGILNLRLKLGVEVVNEQVVHHCIKRILQSGRGYAQKRRSPCPLMYAYYGTEYLGAAHGLTSILQILLSFPHTLRSVDNKAEQDVKTTLDYLLSIQLPNGNFPCAMDEVGRPRSPDHELVHWCHGAPGTIYLLARAWLVFKDQRYLEACKRCGEVIWTQGLLKKGPGICHGIAGNGYAFLLLHQLTKDSEYLNRANAFAAFLDADEFRKGARTPDSPYSLYEGWAGTVCYYVDLQHPDKGEFPLFPVMF